MTTTNNNKLGRASINVLKTCFRELRFPILYFFFLAQIAAAIIKNKPVSIPGIYPAKKSAAIETPPLASEYTIRTLLGGMISPVVAEVILTATPNSLE